MQLKVLVFMGLFFCVDIYAKPPKLGWESGWCWNNVLVQLFYNMRGVTECLLKNADECRKKNEVLAKYIDLITAVRKNPDGFFIEEMRAYHSAYCGAVGCKMCAWRNMFEFYDFISKLSCCNNLVQFNEYNPDGSIKISSAFSWYGTGDDLAQRIIEEKNSVPPLLLGSLPNYLCLLLTGTWTAIEEYIDLTPLLRDDLKTIKKCTYELIGAGSFINNNHFTAYIKDQWDDSPSWYYCNDMAISSGGQTHQKLDKWHESGPWKGVISLLVYKRIDDEHEKPEAERETEQQAQNDESLEKLVKALSYLAV